MVVGWHDLQVLVTTVTGTVTVAADGLLTFVLGFSLWLWETAVEFDTEVARVEAVVDRTEEAVMDPMDAVLLEEDCVEIDSMMALPGVEATELE